MTKLKTPEMNHFITCAFLTKNKNFEISIMTYKIGKNYKNTPETKMSQKLPIKLGKT